MPTSASGAVYRGLSSPGSPSECNGDSHRLPRARLSQSSGGGAWPTKYVVLLVFVLVFSTISLIFYNHGYRSQLDTSEATAKRPVGSQAGDQQQLSAAIEQLRNDQATMMELLQVLAQSAANGTSSEQTQQQLLTTDQSEQQQAHKTTDELIDEPNTAATKPAAAIDIPAAIAALPALTKLHNSVLRSSKDFERHRKTMQQLLDKLVHLEQAAAKQEIDQQLQQAHEPLTTFVYEFYQLILSTGRLIPCREDTTLVGGDTMPWPTGSAAANSSTTSSGTSSTGHLKYFIATNLRDNSVQMPQFLLSLLQTLLRLPREAAFVSVYESNSDDGAHGWIDVLQLALNVIGTPSRLVARGMLVRTEGQDRIEFLAQVRNMAMAPLYLHYADPASSTPSSSSSTGSTSSGTSVPPGHLPWDPDYVVFINDVYFCWSMVLRLMNYRADITCGLDFWQNQDATAALPFDKRAKSHQPKPNFPSEYRIETLLADAMSRDQRNPIVFYDIWVARDVTGAKFWWGYPFITDPQSSHAVAKGLPVRASCCWNGLVVLSAEPFKKGLRFRKHLEEGAECRASECTLLCEDYARLGYDRVVVDAGVQVAYDWELAREMAAVGVEGVGVSTWAQAKAAGIAQAEQRPAYHDMECCSLRPGAKWVSFFTDCSRRDIMGMNYTEQALQTRPW